MAAIRAAIGDRKLVVFDALAEAQAIGDTQGRTTNVVALGVLSTIAPFSTLPVGLWQRALLRASPGEMVQRANLAAFTRGREAGARAALPV
jgi:indolepyruvate ferredoxin oxidoreductase alpha subunit